MSATFATPAAPTAGVKWENHKDALIILSVKGEEQGIKTAYGETDAVRATVDVIEGAGAGASYSDCLIFPKILVAQLRSLINQQVLGRLTQGIAKPSQSAPWILSEASPTDTKTAEKWLAARTPGLASPEPPF